jgi:hypothetical protein
VLWRDYLVSEHHIIGRMVRTPEYKYVKYKDDPVEQLFDMVHDPQETKNLYEDAKYAQVLQDHRKMLAEWSGLVKPVKPTPANGPLEPIIRKYYKEES